MAKRKCFHRVAGRRMLRHCNGLTMTASTIELPSRNGFQSFLERHGLQAGRRGYRLRTSERSVDLRWYGGDARSLARCRTARMVGQWLWGMGCRQIPEPLVWDESLRLGLFASVTGRRLRRSEINLARLGEALAYLMAINRARALAAGRGFPAIAGASFSIGGRLEGIHRLVARLSWQTVGQAAIPFIVEELEPAWQIISNSIRQRGRQAGLSLDTPLSLAERCLAPLDFGFHQARLTRDKKLVFTDCPGVGWEDPAWLVDQLFCQRICPPLALWKTFARNWSRALGQGSEVVKRAQVLIPACRFQQLCRALSGPLAEAKISARRLAAARKGLREMAEAQLWEP